MKTKCYRNYTVGLDFQTGIKRKKIKKRSYSAE